MKNEYHPKGSMCMTCTHSSRMECKELPFSTMKVMSSWIEKDRTAKHHVVYCTDFRYQQAVRGSAAADVMTTPDQKPPSPNGA